MFVRWKLGQLRPGDTVQFRRISQDDAVALLKSAEYGTGATLLDDHSTGIIPECKQDPKLHVAREDKVTRRPRVVFRQVNVDHVLPELWLTVGFIYAGR